MCRICLLMTGPACVVCFEFNGCPASCFKLDFDSKFQSCCTIHLKSIPDENGYCQVYQTTLKQAA